MKKIIATLATLATPQAMVLMPLTPVGARETL